MDFILLFFIFIALELFESNWQKSDSLYGVINNNYLLFRKNVFLYFILHISFFYTIFLSFYFNNFGFWMSSIFIVKFADISLKLSIMKKISTGIPLSDIVPTNIKILPIFSYFNIFLYPLTFILSMY